MKHLLFMETIRYYWNFLKHYKKLIHNENFTIIYLSFANEQLPSSRYHHKKLLWTTASSLQVKGGIYAVGGVLLSDKFPVVNYTRRLRVTFQQT